MSRPAHRRAHAARPSPPAASGVVEAGRASARSPLRRVLTVVAVLAQLLGSLLLTEAVAAKTSAPLRVGSLAPLLYTEPAPCVGCATTIGLESAGVQKRAGSVLFDIHGTWPVTAPLITGDVRLVVDDLELVLRPPASGDVFSVVHFTKASAAIAPTGVAAGLQGGALLIDVPSTLVAIPLHFEVGLWSGSAYTVRLPRSGQLSWDGVGAPHPPVAAPTSTTQPPSSTTAPTPTAPTTSSPAPTTVAPGVPAAQITALAEACAPIPSGQVPAALAITAVARGTQAPPGAGGALPWVGLRFAAPVGPTLSGPPFSVTATLLPADAGPPAAGRPVDRVGTVQLWLWWDGSATHRAIRTFDGIGWQMRVDPPDLQVSVTAQQIQFFSALIGASDGYGFVVSVPSGCEASTAPGRNPATGR